MREFFFLLKKETSGFLNISQTSGTLWSEPDVEKVTGTTWEKLVVAVERGHLSVIQTARKSGHC
jgi:hypothetical protein